MSLGRGMKNNRGNAHVIQNPLVTHMYIYTNIYAG